MAAIVTDVTTTAADGSTVRTITYVDGSQSVQFTPGPGTPAANAVTLQTQAGNAMATNRTYIALASPSTVQNTAQIKALSQQNVAIIRLLLGQLDATN